MCKRVTIQLTNGDVAVHDYYDTVVTYDGVLTVVIDRDCSVSYPLTSVVSWGVNR